MSRKKSKTINTCHARIVGGLVFLLLSGWGAFPGAFLVGKTAVQQSQETATDQAVGLEQGPMQKIAPAVKPILKMKFDVDEKSISVDQESWGKTDSLEEQKKAIRKQMLGRGMDQAMIDRMVDRMAQSQLSFGPIVNLFGNVRSSGGMRSSSSSSSGGSRRLSSSSAELTCTVTLATDTFEMRIVEIGGPSRTLDVSSGVGTRMLLTGDDMLAMLNQSESGIMGVLIEGDKVASERAADYYALSVEHPELHTKLAAIFRHAGVDLPLGVNEPAVKAVTIRMLGSMYSGDRGALLKLIEQLNSNEFSEREAASKKIEESFATFEGAILKELASDELSIEARNRLDVIVKRQEKTRKGDTRAEDCVMANKLLDSTDYLIGLLQGANEEGQRLITHHLAKTTEQDFGMDIEKWQDWWRGQAK